MVLTMFMLKKPVSMTVSQVPYLVLLLLIIIQVLIWIKLLSILKVKHWDWYASWNENC